jgi:hypothetical protein
MSFIHTKSQALQLTGTEITFGKRSNYNEESIQELFNETLKEVALSGKVSEASLRQTVFIGTGFGHIGGSTDNVYKCGDFEFGLKTAFHITKNPGPGQLNVGRIADLANVPLYLALVEDGNGKYVGYDVGRPICAQHWDSPIGRRARQVWKEPRHFCYALSSGMKLGIQMQNQKQDMQKFDSAACIAINILLGSASAVQGALKQNLTVSEAKGIIETTLRSGLRQCMLQNVSASQVAGLIKAHGKADISAEEGSEDVKSELENTGIFALLLGAKTSQGRSRNQSGRVESNVGPFGDLVATLPEGEGKGKGK